MSGRRGVLADWVAAVRGTLAMRRARGRRGQRRIGLVVGGVVLTLAFLGLFVLGIRAEITDGGGHDDSTQAGSAQSDVPALAGAGTSSSTTGDGTAATTTADGSTSGGTDAPTTTSTVVLGRNSSTTSQAPARRGGGSDGSTVLTTTTTVPPTTTTQPPGSTSPTTAPADPGVVGGLLDLLGLG